MKSNTINKQERAKEKVAQLKGFYIHLIVYVVINTGFMTMKLARNLANGESFFEAIWDFGTFATPFFWGIGLVFHAFKVFSFNPFFSKDWEERQIKKYMEEDKMDIKKFK
tara:strand:+ start:113972 stop:114301 length:330 start_codon:yes stop_codon:yes gene_type:complete